MSGKDLVDKVLSQRLRQQGQIKLSQISAKPAAPTKKAAKKKGKQRR